MPERVARQRINRKQNHIQEQNHCANSYSHVSVKKESVKRVAPKENEEDEAHIKEEAMQILKNKGKHSLSSVAAFSAFTYGTGRRIEKESTVVSFPVVVARDAKAQRPNQNQQCRREWPPPMVRVNQRRIKGRKIRPPLVIRPFEGTQSCINSECAEHNNRWE